MNVDEGGKSLFLNHKQFHLQLFSSNLQQKLDDKEEILGYLKDDVKKEIKRASKLTCFYCRLKGANIGCCRKSCRKSFHLPCLLQHNGSVQFCDKFDSFCHIHHNVERSSIHSKEEICSLYSQNMMEIHAITSIELNCCGSKESFS